MTRKTKHVTGFEGVFFETMLKPQLPASKRFIWGSREKSRESSTRSLVVGFVRIVIIIIIIMIIT